MQVSAVKSVSFFGVLAGGITDIVATNIFLFPVGIAAVLIGHVAQLAKSQQPAALAATMHAHPLLYITALFLGCVASVLGGYVAALLSQHDEVLNGALSSFLCVGMGIYGIIRGGSEPLPVEVAMMPLSVALAAFGGYLMLMAKSRGSKVAG